MVVALDVCEEQPVRDQDLNDPDGRARAACWSHLRRKIFGARSGAPKEADEALSLIRQLFRVEHDATERRIVRSPAHLALRAERSSLFVAAFFQWELFLTDPRIPLHNNSSEARLRVIALARHNYLFFGNPRAGRNFARLYSLVGSCIANGVEPTEYLTDILPRIGDAATEDQLDALLPGRWQSLGPAP
jgi:transposase